MKEAIESLATNLVLVHNHPSGNEKPSKEDDDITIKLHTACSYLDIYMMDHVVITESSYYSYRDNNRLK